MQGVGVIGKRPLPSETPFQPILGSWVGLPSAWLPKRLEQWLESLIRGTSAGGHTPASGEMRKGDRERCAKRASFEFYLYSIYLSSLSIYNGLFFGKRPEANVAKY